MKRIGNVKRIGQIKRAERGKRIDDIWKRTGRRRLAVIAFAGILCIGSLVCTGCAKPYAGQEAPELLEPVGVKADTAEAFIGDISTTIAYDGQLVPQTKEVTAGLDGILGEWKVAPGDTVKKGQLLVALSGRELQHRQKELKDKLENQELQNEIENQMRECDIEALRLRLRQMEEAAAPQQDIALLRLEIEMEEVKLRQERERQEFMLADLSAEWERLLKEQEAGKRKAPVSGKVIYVCGAKDTPVQEDTVVAIIAAEENVKLRCEFISRWDMTENSRYYVLLHGKEYEAVPEPYDREEYLSASLSGKSFYSYFTVNAPEEVLIPGDYAGLFLVAQEQKDVCLVPVNAVYRSGDGNYVYRMEGQERVRHMVSTGLQSETLVEITEGLTEGDIVYVKN